MKTIVLDIETTYALIDKRKNPSPYLDTNSLVSIGIKSSSSVGGYWFFSHKELSEPAQQYKEIVQKYIDDADLIIGHNLKFDISWMLECGWKIDKPLYDTMIGEYVFSKGRKQPLSLKECCLRYGLTQKSDVLTEYFDKGFNTDEIPMAELKAYGIQDIESTYELYQYQQKLIAESEEHAYMSKAITLMNNTLPSLIDIERNGICIDEAELASVEKQYREEYDTLAKRLNEIVVDVMGHTVINLDSPEHLSWVIYSRKVKDKIVWKELFNLGSEWRGSVLKTKYPKRYSKDAFVRIVREHTDKLRKTEAHQCQGCLGKGHIRKTKVNGEPFKKDTLCKVCAGAGFVYIELSSYAGLKLQPMDSTSAAVGGFSTDKTTLQAILQEDLPLQAREFLTGLLRINAISTYLTTFVEGIKKNVKNHIIHPSFNQCITATGRLSSSNPNFQNLPRAKTFPIRKVIKSRFEGGKILSVDFKQLEFRVAAILARDEQAKQDILNDVDIHAFTRDTITAAGQPMDRQDAKIRTFKPLYGGISGTSAEEAYYAAFLQKYKGIDTWQKALQDEALNTGQIRSPSGRIYAFPNAKRLGNGTVSGHTQIKNYIVQGFATGDICPVALIEIYKIMKRNNLKSKLCLTVHDDISADVHPDEIEHMIHIFKTVFKGMNAAVFSYFDVQTEIPIEGEISCGANWLDKKVVA